MSITHECHMYVGTNGVTVFTKTIMVYNNSLHKGGMDCGGFLSLMSAGIVFDINSSVD